MTPQTAIIPDTITAAVYIEANVRGQEAVKAACRAALAALDGCRRRFPGHELGMTIAFGADFWHSLGHKNEGREIRPFVPLGNGLCPATQCDLMIHIQSKHGGLNYLLAEQVLAAFGSAIDVQNETHGFRMPEERGLDGFVDGTENPHGAEAVAAVAAIAAGADAGGSYVVLQQYLHDLAKWSRLSLAEQEQSVEPQQGRKHRISPRRTPARFPPRPHQHQRKRRGSENRPPQPALRQSFRRTRFAVHRLLRHPAQYRRAAQIHVRRQRRQNRPAAATYVPRGTQRVLLRPGRGTAGGFVNPSRRRGAEAA
ncbi:Dyp-type peroxidase [Kingella potus]|uniref:Dyp-type peroxidase n=1 Tax=Kingella potus TaxID=265175 RepID=UPI003CC7C491